MKNNILSEIHLSNTDDESLYVAHAVLLLVQSMYFKRRFSRKMKGAADILIDLACIPLYSSYQDLLSQKPA